MVNHDDQRKVVQKPLSRMYFSIDELNAERVINNGSFKGKKVSLSDDLEFSGSSKIESGTLNNIKAATSRLVLVDTSVIGNIFFRKGTSSSRSFCEKCLSFFDFETKIKSPQVLELSGKSIVIGDVTFEGDQGEVHLFDAPQIKGNVVSAKIIQKQQNHYSELLILGFMLIV